jgi:glycosyltransferase involved in cell wall biosynthesis
VTPDRTGGPRIAACIVCRNEATKLADCLDSVDWADEILVMDLESTDESAAVARDRRATVIRREPFPIVEPLRDEIASHASSEWVLALDPDERVTPGLAAALRDAAARSDIDAVVMPRMNIDFGWPSSAAHQRFEPQLRMYRRSAVSWPHFPNRLPDVPKDRVLRLPDRDDLVLTHLRNVSVAETADRLVRYAPAQGAAMLAEGQEFSAGAMGRALWRQVKRHLIDARAWRDGMPGIARAIVLINHHVYVWLAFWLESGGQRTARDDASVKKLGRVLEPVRRTVRLRRRLQRILGRGRKAHGAAGPS